MLYNLINIIRRGINDMDELKFSNIIRQLQNNQINDLFAGSEMSSEQIFQLAANLAPNNSLKKLTLHDVLHNVFRRTVSVAPPFSNGYAPHPNDIYNSQKDQDDEAIAIAQALELNSNVQYLDLSGKQITNKGAMAIAKTLTKNKSVTKLVLRDTYIKEDGIIAIANALQVNSSIQEFALESYYTKPTAKSLLALVKAVEINSSLFDMQLAPVVDLQYPSQMNFIVSKLKANEYNFHNQILELARQVESGPLSLIVQYLFDIKKAQAYLGEQTSPFYKKTYVTNRGQDRIVDNRLSAQNEIIADVPEARGALPSASPNSEPTQELDLIKTHFRATATDGVFSLVITPKLPLLSFKTFTDGLIKDKNDMTIDMQSTVRQDEMNIETGTEYHEFSSSSSSSSSSSCELDEIPGNLGLKRKISDEDIISNKHQKFQK